jgi:glycosyltransferase involved in cell wall biosynthesis
MHGVCHQDVPVWLNAADVLLLCSRHEGSPNIVKEALACACPVVSVDVGDVAERIGGVTGCYLSAPQPAALAEKLRAVHKRSERIQTGRVMHELSLESVARRILSVYRLAAARRYNHAGLAGAAAPPEARPRRGEQ